MTTPNPDPAASHPPYVDIRLPYNDARLVRELAHRLGVSDAVCVTRCVRAALMLRSVTFGFHGVQHGFTERQTVGEGDSA